MAKINLEQAINELRLGVFNNQLGNLEFTLPSTISFRDETILYGAALANYAAQNKYGSIELTNLLNELQLIGLKALEKESCMNNYAMQITDLGNIYQKALGNLIKSAVKNADENALFHIIETYISISTAVNALKSNKNDINDRKIIFLENQRTQIAEAYLNKPATADDKFYFNRFKTMIKYIAQNSKDPNLGKLTQNVRYQARQTDILYELVNQINHELNSGKVKYQEDEVHELIYQSIEKIKDKTANKIITDLAFKFPGYASFLKYRTTLSGKIDACLFS